MSSTCIICLEELDDTNNISITKCNHKFHTSCLLEYNNKKCAICRTNIASEITPRIINNSTTEDRQEYNFDVVPNEGIIFSLFGRNQMNILLFKLFYITSQIYVAILLIYCLNILTTLLMMVIYEIHLRIGNYIF